jgi:hypothetical protein
MKLTYRKLMGMAGVIRQLPYAKEYPETNLKLALVLCRIEEAEKTFNIARQKAWKELMGDQTDFLPGDPRQAKFQVIFDQLLSQEIAVDLPQFKLASLEASGVQLSASQMFDLAPIIEDLK